MGSAISNDEDSNQVKIPQSTIINSLRHTFRLSIVNKDTNSTKSCIHSDFANQINQKDKGEISKIYSPFCILKNSKSLFANCALISPICAITLNINYVQNPSTLSSNLTICGKLTSDEIKQPITDVYACESNSICMMLIQKPIWQLGWCSMSYFNNSKSIGETVMYTIRNSQKQQSKQYYEKVFYQDMGNFIGKGNYEKGSIIFVLIKRKPSLIGIQISQEFCKFFNQSSYEQMKYLIKDHLTLERQHKYLHQIDVVQFQIKTRW